MIFIIAAVILGLDQSVKFLLSKNLSLGQPIPIIKNIFYLTLVHNQGAAFGVFKNLTFVFVLTAFVVVILIIRDLRQVKKVNLYALSLALILAGAIGNLIDRLRFGYVIDFFDFRVWPVFNIADSSITIGAILLGWIICFRKSAR